MPELVVCIFTYNRPKHLLNCVESLEALLNVPYKLHIYDDASTEKKQIEVLEKLKEKYAVFYNTSKSLSNAKVKGLYSNMNKALDHVKQQSFEYCLLLQDDTQMVRAFSEQDFISIKKALNLEHVFAITSFFYKKNHPKDYQNLLKFNELVNCYVPKSLNQNYLTGIADMGFFSVAKIIETNWEFENQEAKHIEKGRKMGLVRAATKNPFFSFLPWPSTSRGGYGTIKKIVVCMLDRYFNTGYHPLRYMDDAALDKLNNRELYDFPFAEDFLETKEDINLHTPWNFYDSFYPFKKGIKKILKI